MAISIIGVTGPSGSGKTMLCRYFEAQGIPVIYADPVYHSLLIPPSDCLRAIEDTFGSGVMTADGGLDRKKLGKIVFSDPDKLELLNKTVLGFVLDKIREIISGYENSGNGLVFVDAPTLIESGFHHECSKIVAVIAPLCDRIEKISARDGITPEEVNRRISAQREDGFYTSVADFVFSNNFIPSFFEENAADLLCRIRKVLESEQKI